MKNEQKLYIGQLAADLGINPKTIRYYEDIGLLPNPQRGANGYRFYTSSDRERLGFILQAKKLGFTLEEIAEIFAIRNGGQSPCDQVLRLLDKKLRVLDEELRTIHALRRGVLELRQEAAKTMTLSACVCGIIEFHTISQ